MEALLRALSRPTDAELELGLLKRRVRTMWGERELELEIPSRRERVRPGELFCDDRVSAGPG